MARPRNLGAAGGAHLLRTYLLFICGTVVQKFNAFAISVTGVFFMGVALLIDPSGTASPCAFFGGGVDRDANRY